MRRLVSGFLLLAFAVACNPTMANGQRPAAVAGVHYGIPLKWSALLGLGLHVGEGRTAFLAGEPGIGGWRVSAGYARMTTTLGTGFSVRASLLRTEQRAWRAPPDTHFAGVEVQLFPLFALGPRIGMFVPLRNSSARRMLTADVGFAL